MDKIPEIDIQQSAFDEFSEFHILSSDEVGTHVGCAEIIQPQNAGNGRVLELDLDNLTLGMLDSADNTNVNVEKIKNSKLTESIKSTPGSQIACDRKELSTMEQDDSIVSQEMRYATTDDIKMEFSCESEQILENDLRADYFIEDVNRKEVIDDCNCSQVEIYSEEHVSLPPEQSMDMALYKDTQNDTDNDLSRTADDNLELSSIMSDHNYTSQEQASHGEILRRLLTNHILSNSVTLRPNKEVADFVSMTIEKIVEFSKEGAAIEAPINRGQTEYFLAKDDSDDGDSFVRNVFDAVLAEDAAEEEEEYQFIKNNSLRAASLKAAETENLDSLKFTETSDKQKTNACEKLGTEKINKCLEPSEKSQISNCNQNETQTNIVKKPETYVLEQNEFPPSLSENCSEPLEHTTFDEAFDMICNSKCSEIHITTQLEQLRLFAKTMHEDCVSFASSTTDIRDKFCKYLKDKFEKLKGLLQFVVRDLNVDKANQTEHQLSRRKLKKRNRDNKIRLLDLSDSTGSLSDEAHSENAQTFQPEISQQKKTDVRIVHIEEQNETTEYDDGVPLVKYTQSEIFETETLSNEHSSTPKSSGDEQDNDSEGIGSKTKSRASVNGKVSRSESDKENSSAKVVKTSKTKSNGLSEDDKEIQRLINLNVLDKRTTYGGSLKNSEKSKTKSQIQKNKDSILSFSDDEFQKDFGSDESMSESEEETMTEKQYLARYNESLKQQLLNGSSSDSSDVDEVSDEVLTEDGDGSKSPLVDKFLKKFNINESDDEIEKPKEGPPQSKRNSISENLDSDKSKKDREHSSGNSDCELLDDAFVSHKHNKPKSLEKMLLEVDKRKKINKICDDLISLSSESESSDVEAVEEAKSRIIKPMLRQDQLASETRKAQKQENDRIRRLEKKNTMLAKVLKERHDINKNQELILDYNEETKTFIKVHPDIVKHLKQHQIEGVKFMYDSCYGGVDALKKHPGSGCILAHCMGLGKTLQLIALLHTVISYKELKTTKVLVLCPKSTVMNWADEIKRWLGPLKTRNIKHYTFNDISDINDKLKVLGEWSASARNGAGILLIGYEAFRTLVCYHSYKNRGINSARLENIREDVDKYLLNPGADLVVCDEGHIIKNSKSAISLAVSQIKTPKRIILTGTPIQNNLKEYYSMVNFIKPLFLGTEKEFANLYANPIKNGQHKDSSKRDIKIMKQRSFVLHKKLSKFVQRKEAELLKSFLPQKFEYVLFIPMTSVQNNLYEHILETIEKGGENRGKSLITDYTCLRKIWTHPKVLEDAWKNATQKPKKDLRKNQVAHSDDEQPDDVYDSHTGAMSVTNDWWRNLLAEQDLETILPSNKLRTMFEILRMCEEKGEKCLIFSAFVAVLNVVEYFFKKITDRDSETLNHLNISPNNPNKHTWMPGKDYYRLDGKTPKLIRHEMVEQFNSTSNSRARVFLISARAGGQGINLVGANRVIILDTSWNPSNDQQNIFRIFRLGQKKNCYIYRLLAMGTMEEKVYSRSVTKQAMSFRVVDEQQIDRHYNMAELGELYTLSVPDYAVRPMPECPQDTILASLLLNYPHLVYKYHEHDSLLENKVEQELSEQEKADAWAAYERELQMNSEIREVPNLDDMQNNFAASKFPNFLNHSLSGFDMSSFLNYGSHFQPFLQSMLPQYNYPPSSQQYFELYKRIAQTNFGLSDVNTSSSAFNPPAYGQSSNKPLSTASPLLPVMHGNTLHSNPLSALGDLSIYGMNTSNNLSLSNTPSAAHRQHNTPMYDSSASSNTNANLLLSSFGQYKQTSENNSLQNLYDFRHEYPTQANAINKLKMQNSHSNQLKPPPYSTAPGNSNYGADKNIFPSLNAPTYKSMELNKNKQSAKIDKNQPTEDATTNAIKTRDPVPSPNKTDESFGNSTNSMQVSTISKHNAPLQQIPAKSLVSTTPKVPLPKATDRAPLSSSASQTPLTASKVLSNTQHDLHVFPSTKTSTNSGGSTPSAHTSVNMGIVYPNKNVLGKSANEHLKTSGDMQIIPTTNPLGSGSISRQFNDIAPSISLTALNNTSKTDKNVNYAHKDLSLNVSNTNSCNAVKTPKANAVNKVMSNSNKRAATRPMKPAPVLSGYTSVSTVAKTAAAAAVAAKTSHSSVVQSKYLSGVSVINPKQSTPTGAIVRNVVKIPSTTTTQTQSNSGRTCSPIVTMSQQNENIKTFLKPVSSIDARCSPLAVSVTPVISQKQKTAAANTQTSTPTGSKNFLNIRPVDNKKSPSGTGVYIIEANINQKKIAVGAPTKSGGGTTITKVPLQRKRKAQEPSNMSIPTAKQPK